MRRGLVLFILVAQLAYAVHGQESARANPSNIRSESQNLRDAMHLGLSYSPTFRAMVTELAQSNLIIHLEATMPPRGVDGMLRFVTTAGGFRYVRISLAPHLTPNVLVAMIGHELRHAVEIARAPEVIDQISMGRLYHRIGLPCNAATFDTRAAVSVGTRVLGELQTELWTARLGDARASDRTASR